MVLRLLKRKGKPFRLQSIDSGSKRAVKCIKFKRQIALLSTASLCYDLSERLKGTSGASKLAGKQIHLRRKICKITNIFP